jgi:hypothetical protein
MSKLNTPWSLDADAVRDNTGRIVVETINCGETFAEEIVKCVNGYADLEAEIKQADSDVERIEIDRSMIPEGAVLLEAYLHEGALVVMHEEVLGELGEEHNCDAMGCGTGSHVWARIPLDAMCRITQLEAALREIAKGEGAFSRDQLTHAENCIDNMKSIAQEALQGKAGVSRDKEGG